MLEWQCRLLVHLNCKQFKSSDSMGITDFQHIFQYVTLNAVKLKIAYSKDGNVVTSVIRITVIDDAKFCCFFQTFFLRYGGGNCVFECKFEKNCEITSASRTQCKYCRYQKCIQAGMCRKGEEGSRYVNEMNLVCVCVVIVFGLECCRV